MENGATAAPTNISDSQRIQNATDYKNDGNKLHKDGNLRQAIGKYHRALLQLKGIGQSKNDVLGYLSGQSSSGNNLSDDIKAQISKIELDCYNNLAASLLKQESPSHIKIIEYCNKVLAIEPDNEKALYRKGTALNTLGKYEETIHTLEFPAKDLSLLRKPLTTARHGQKLQGEILKKNLEGMFDSK